MKNIALASTLILAFSSAALAEPEPKKDPAKPAEKKAPAAEQAMPAKPDAAPIPEMKPAAELEQLKPMIGSWKCSGKVIAMGTEMASESTQKTSLSLDNYWVVTDGAEKKKAKEKGYKSHDMMGYDAGGKQFVRMMIDNMGTSATMTSKGWQGDKMEWTGSAKMMGQDAKLFETVTKDATGKQVAYVGHYLLGTEKPVQWNLTCKK
jgi:Protein of unknown function (DUF1579)